MFPEDGESVCTDISNRVNNHLIPNRSLLRYRYSDLHSKKKTHYLSPNSLNHLPQPQPLQPYTQQLPTVLQSQPLQC
ncbi:hypothetical protein GBAR_LOCUS29314, partial [Geodia barretti]